MIEREPKKKQHYSWWPYIREIVREYPEQANPLPPGVAVRNWESVHCAVRSTERMTDGQDRLKLVRLLHWDKTHTLEGAALVIPCSRRTAAYWQREFFEMVARNRDLLD